LHPAQHLVLDLNQVSRIEKLLEQFIGDPLGAGIQGAQTRHSAGVLFNVSPQKGRRTVNTARWAKEWK
jgi:hypothetical protein